MLVISMVCACYMTGVVWVIHLLIYPGFAHYGERFLTAHAGHTARMGWIVGPVMLLELVSAMWLLFSPAYGGFDGMPELWNLSQAALAAASWLLTGFIFVPMHRAFERNGFNARIHARLLRLNRWRVAVWTVRSMLLAGVNLT